MLRELYTYRATKAAFRAAFFFIAFVLWCSPVFASAAIRAELDRLFQQSSPRGASWSVLVEPLDGGQTLYSRQPDRNLIPASNMKLLPVAAILLEFGPDYTFPTRLYAEGRVSEGVLHGNLVVVGSGDPSIGGRFNGGNITGYLREWAEQLKRQGVTRISGDVIGVDALFDDERVGLNWHPSDLTRWYAAEVSALNLNDGCLDVIVRGGANAGSSVSVSTVPNTQYVRLINELRTVAQENQAQGVHFIRDVETRTIRMTGSVARNQTVRLFVTAPNPSEFFVTVLKEVLEEEGIAVGGVSRRAPHGGPLEPDESWNLLYTHHSPPLLQLAEVCLVRSQNLYSEHFLKALGARLYGVGSYESGTLAIKDILLQYGCDIDGLYIGDGSGLSRESRVNSLALVTLLRAVEQTEYAETFRECLPLAGQTGTLRNRMRGVAAQGRVRAKTGTLNGVRGLSGFIEARSGAVYVFSMLANGPTSAPTFTQIMDQACSIIAAQG